MIMHRTLLSASALILGAMLFASGKAAADQVIPDDLIVQGSTCVGLDCVNNESFGFDTLRLKENNTRITFFDTSALSGFPANHWTITANDSASGGANYLAFDDVTSGRQPFRVTAGAPTASLFVASSGKVGFRTAAPVLDLHVATSDTPGQRLEQTSAGGFTAQTWDVAGNEANFFVRDVTGGSRLPFRIRPGAPTSSIDISATGNVGMGTASPKAKLHVSGGVAGVITPNNDADDVVVESSGNGGLSILVPDANNSNLFFGSPANTAGSLIGFNRNSGLMSFNNNTSGGQLVFLANGGQEKMRIAASGNIGIGTASPAAQLHTTGGVRLAGVANCASGIQSNVSGDLSCLVSSRQFKNIAGDLPAGTALANVMALRPQTGTYKETPDVHEHWLIAEDVAAVDPALVGLNDGRPYVVKTQNVVADLVAVVQYQQRQIEELKRLVAAK